MIFANVTSWTIPEGSVTRVTDSNGDIIWQLGSDPHTPYYITATYYPVTTSFTQILDTKTGVTLMEYNGVEYEPDTYLRFSQTGANQTVKIYLDSPSVNLYEMFRDIDRVNAVEIGKGITNAYKDNLSLNHNVWFRTATVESGNSVYATRGNGIVRTSDGILMVGGANTSIDSSVTGIGANALGCVARGTDGSSTMTNNGVSVWDINGNTCTTLGDSAFWGTRKITTLNLRGYILRQSQNLPSSAFYSFGDSGSSIHIPRNTSLTNTIWQTELVTSRATGYKWTVCADL